MKNSFKFIIALSILFTTPVIRAQHGHSLSNHNVLRHVAFQQQPRKNNSQGNNGNQKIHANSNSITGNSATNSNYQKPEKPKNKEVKNDEKSKEKNSPSGKKK